MITDKRALAFSQKQRQQSLEARLPSRSEGASNAPLPIQPFDGVGKLLRVDWRDYLHLSNYVKKVVGPRDDIAGPVTDFMVNLFLNLPNHLYEPGKDYSSRERAFTKDQLTVFRNELNVAEVVCDMRYNRPRGNLGSFKNKRTYKVEDIGELMQTNLWTNNEKFHLILIRDPDRMVPGEFTAGAVASQIVYDKYKTEIKELESYESRLDKVANNPNNDKSNKQT